MTRGEDTRDAILDRALLLSARVGLAGLTIGQLAGEAHMSKSGLFAHFGSKEGLQVAVVEAAAARFVDEVVRPALKAPRGEPRLRALFERWLAWGTDTPAGCFFVAASAELDDQPGAARDAVVRAQRDWLDTLAGAVRIAVAEGHLPQGTDPEQVAFAIQGIMLSAHHAERLLENPKAHAFARKTFDQLVRSLGQDAGARPPKK
jgi:AcrR family transcriptional regulator